MPYDTSLALPVSQYVAERTPKNLIVLHFSAGSTAKGSLDWWASTPERVATAYLVEKDGSVIEAFSPTFWASHIGGEGAKNHKRSIGIEIVNEGPLKMAPDASLTWWPKNFGQFYCSTHDIDRFVHAPYRGFNYWAAFPNRQVASVKALVDDLCGRFSIPKQIAPAPMRLEYNPDFFGAWRGIATHVNYRKDKTDIGPAWPWERLL